MTVPAVESPTACRVVPTGSMRSSTTGRGGGAQSGSAQSCSAISARYRSQTAPRGEARRVGAGPAGEDEQARREMTSLAFHMLAAPVCGAPFLLAPRTLTCRARHFYHLRCSIRTIVSCARAGVRHAQKPHQSNPRMIPPCEGVQVLWECRCWAETASPPSIRDDSLTMERRWLSLARGYELAEQLDSFTSPRQAKNPRTEGRDSR
jgi:hypothetical protein